MRTDSASMAPVVPSIRNSTNFRVTDGSGFCRMLNQGKPLRDVAKLANMGCSRAMSHAAPG
jgi:hypothetical protein